jgi:hypothetical protein
VERCSRRETGLVQDHFTIIKGTGGGNAPPSVNITSPTNGASFTAPAQVAIEAAASLTAKATDNAGAVSTSTAVTITVNGAGEPPPAPTGLQAVGGTAR